MTILQILEIPCGDHGYDVYFQYNRLIIVIAINKSGKYEHSIHIYNIYTHY